MSFVYSLYINYIEFPVKMDFTVCVWYCIYLCWKVGQINETVEEVVARERGCHGVQESFHFLVLVQSQRVTSLPSQTSHHQ